MWRPRRLPQDRRAAPRPTLDWEEPVFSHDIFAATEEWHALVDSKRRLERNEVDTLFEQWTADTSNHVPVHRANSGRGRAGEVDWSMLSLLITKGASRNIFAAVGAAPVQRRRQRILDALAKGEIQTVVGGVGTTPTEVHRVDGTRGPWIDGFAAPTIRIETTQLRNACYIFCAALTMMRDSELLSLTKGSVSTFYGAPAVRSKVHKKRSTPETAYWWIIEPVAQAIAVAERLSDENLVFGSVRHNRNGTKKMQRFDRHEELDKFVTHVNEIAPQAGLAPIPTSHLAPHMFRRTMAIIAAQEPDGEIALGLQLKHAARRAVANGTTVGYAAETPAWAAQFEHELQESVAARLVGYWAQNRDTALTLAGAGAQRLRIGIDEVSAEVGPSVQVGDNRLLHTLLRQKFSTIRWGTVNHCLGVPENALCLRGKDPEVVARGPIPNQCNPVRCPNSVVTSEHAPIWLAEEADLIKHLSDRHLAPHTRAQLEDELKQVQAVTKGLFTIEGVVA